MEHDYFKYEATISPALNGWIFKRARQPHFIAASDEEAIAFLREHMAHVRQLLHEKKALDQRKAI